ncbi:MAG: prolyl oligopeptidase family serine peptidase [Rikenellaceae bacterium]
MRKIILLALLLACSLPSKAQHKYKKLFYGDAVVPTWDSDGSFTYSVNTPEGAVIYRVNPEAKSKERVEKVEPKAKKEARKGAEASLFIKDNNLYLKGKEKDDKPLQLSFDGTTQNSYTSNFRFSPDSTYVVVNKVRAVEKREVTFVESSPADQVQPKLHSNIYEKPGDELVVTLPVLFDLTTNQKVDVDFAAYTNQFDIRYLRWSPDSKSYIFEFNERGHQRYQVVKVDVKSGTTKVVIDESSPTFIFYNKVWRHYLDKRGEMLWISERDGWRHLYLYDADGENLVKLQLTSGEWVVRDVLYVDEEAEEIYFTASGRNKGENPYYSHLCRVDFDGKGFKELTKEPGNHKIYISPNREYFVDVCSTPEVEPVSTLRKLRNGAEVMTLERGDASEAKAAGWMTPQVFVAKGRDGVTDIWGNVYLPEGYDPTKKYPVIEYIYAGPHDSHVINDFHIDTYYRSSFATHDYIVVQIDGMGTYNRSKAFHDVCWKNLKDAGFPDRILWIKAVADKYKSFDLDRVGIYGVSAGGQNSTGALLFHGDFYKAAASSCGCHDNRMDKIWWNEQWMGYPIGKEYAESSNVDNAHRLTGRLMLIVGEMDTNVDPASTMQVVDKLVKSEKYFELLVLPGQGHTLGGYYGMDRVVDFFDRNLKNSPLEFKH